MGAYTSPATAALRSAKVPVIVIDDDAFAPELNAMPVVDPKVSVPFVTESESESDVAVAAVSVRLIVLAKLNELFSFKLAVAGAAMPGGEAPLPVTASDTVADAINPSNQSLKEICSASDPVNPAFGV